MQGASMVDRGWPIFSGRFSIYHIVVFRATFADRDTSSIMNKPHERLLLDLSDLEWHSLTFNISQFGDKEIDDWILRAMRH